eukprot:TRINITY_DN34770_c0_g1_i1.p1 TRINITY_DN34770_c0_g1~~TRINITY_DN34770_c0_g1_i1.p1  ORF type:complete len:180 (+),score=68.72 TRINITY_DN34770_c0_g1_i1:38-541(+)
MGGPKGVKLKPWERALLEAGTLKDVTHKGSSSVWLEGTSSAPAEGMALVYRPMGDLEAQHLVDNGQLPSTQPYQAIMEGPAGRDYAEKYLNGKKWVDTSPTTVVEFAVPRAVVDQLMAIQCKPEDGVLSMGLGNKAGGGLPIFNAALQAGGGAGYRIVKVKRSPAKQ